MIIVEGPDNAGKTELIKQLIADDPALRVLYRDRFNPKRGETIGTSYMQVLIPEDGDWLRNGYAIADRFFASECIYGKLFRGGCRMSELEHTRIRRMLEHFYNPLVVFCDPGDGTIKGSWSERLQLYDHDPALIAEAYRSELHEIFEGFAIYLYDWTGLKGGNAQDQRREIHRIHADLYQTRSGILRKLTEAKLHRGAVV